MRTYQSINWLSWLFLLLNLTSAFLISKVPDFNAAFLGMLSINILIALLFAGRINKAVLGIAGLLSGLLFIYSGFVKGVDPLGTQFRIEDYFYAFDSAWAVPYALGLSVFMNAFEFTIGVLLLTRIKARWVNTLALLMMIFFTLTTINDAINNPVPDCGCFGDALIITNWQTLYKNLVIDAFILLLFIRRRDIKTALTPAASFLAFLIIAGGFVGFEFYNIKHLPVIDFRPWKVGNRLLPENPLPVKYYLTYENKETGEEKEFLSTELPWNDSTFKAEWKWKSTREDDPNIEEKRTFPMVDAEGNDWSDDLVSAENGILLISIYDISKVSPEDAGKLKKLYRDAMREGLEVVLLNSDATEVYGHFAQVLQLPEWDVYNSDDTSLKAAVRSNPGLIVIKNATVVGKYHINNLPDIGHIKKLLN
jgi:uncharacterized membrane protein YphA (DoxX/SURF4 family)